jgi:hypothetical protein
MATVNTITVPKTAEEAAALQAALKAHRANVAVRQRAVDAIVKRLAPFTDVADIDDILQSAVTLWGQLHDVPTSETLSAVSVEEPAAS